jgi:thioredoxin
MTLGAMSTAVPVPDDSGRRKATEEKPPAGVVIDVDEANFDRVVRGSAAPVVIHFLAKWAGPCNQFKPVLAGIAKDYAGKAQVVQIDIDAAKRLAEKFNITAVPTVVLMHGGAEKERMQGSRSKQDMIQLLERHTKVKR